MPEIMGESRPEMTSQGDFSISGNTTMEYLESFENSNYSLISGHLLSNDANSNNCVIETNLANDNDLLVGDSFTITNNDQTVTLAIVGIYEIVSSNDMGRMNNNFQNPMNQIYVDLSLAQTLNSDNSTISSATYYLDDPEHIDAFIELAQSNSDIDFDTFTLNADDMGYLNSVISLENITQFATIFLWVVVIAGSLILCLILILSMRGCFYEFGVLLSLGQSKIKIGLQQLIEIIIVATLAFCLSLASGKISSNFISSMLVSSNENQVVMEIPDENNSEEPGQRSKENNPVDKTNNQELDVSITGTTIIQLAQITGALCLISVLLPTGYILRLSPREILTKRGIVNE